MRIQELLSTSAKAARCGLEHLTSSIGTSMNYAFVVGQETHERNKESRRPIAQDFKFHRFGTYDFYSAGLH